jgi:hypothetical protein
MLSRCAIQIGVAASGSAAQASAALTSDRAGPGVNERCEVGQQPTFLLQFETQPAA